MPGQGSRKEVSEPRNPTAIVGRRGRLGLLKSFHNRYLFAGIGASEMLPPRKNCTTAHPHWRKWIKSSSRATTTRFHGGRGRGSTPPHRPHGPPPPRPRSGTPPGHPSAPNASEECPQWTRMCDTLADRWGSGVTVIHSFYNVRDFFGIRSQGYTVSRLLALKNGED